MSVPLTSFPPARSALISMNFQILATSQKAVEIISWPGENGTFESFITFYKSGLLVAGPNGDLKVCRMTCVSFGESLRFFFAFQFFKKAGNQWSEMWTIVSGMRWSGANCFEQQFFCGVSNGTLTKLIDDSDSRSFQAVKFSTR